MLLQIQLKRITTARPVRPFARPKAILNIHSIMKAYDRFALLRLYSSSFSRLPLQPEGFQAGLAPALPMVLGLSFRYPVH